MEGLVLEADGQGEFDGEAGLLDPDFEGRLVEIRGMAGRTIRAAWEQRWPEPVELSDVEVEGLCGICLQRLGDSGEYVVQTFDGLAVVVPPDCVEEFVPPPAEAGGFDLAFFVEGGDSDFGMLVAESLAGKGYCMVQLSISRSLCEDAKARAEDLQDFDLLRRETELDYMGRDNCTRLKAYSMGIPEQAPRDALQVCDKYLTDVGSALCDAAAGILDGELLGRTGAFARLGSAVAPEPFSSEEVEEGRVEPFFEFIKSRRVCMILMLENAGGEIALYPKPGQGAEVTLPMSPGKMLLFRHEFMSYSYQPHGSHFAVQAWLGGGMGVMELQRLHGTQREYADLLEITGPWQPEGDHAYVKSLMVRMPGRSWGYLRYWSMFCGGTDCVEPWNGIRWDKDLYYEPDKDKAIQMGMSYMRHGGFLCEAEFNCFDNDFFDIQEEEARCMYPGQRIVLETGYEALWRAGFSKRRCAGQHIGVHLGDVGPDWHSVKHEWPTYQCGGRDDELKRLGISSSITGSRLSHLLGLVGPINSVATACSSSLVALNIAHHSAINARDDEARKAADKGLDEKHLVVGINTLMGPGAFMVQCCTGGTTYKGRCFTFDMGADGYQRGEGCSAAFLHLRGGEQADIERLATLIGSFVNQDGRSASLTAPNGPSQAALVKAAMRMAGLTPEDVTCCECHGTGTALGDPIEIGALQRVLSKRSRPVLKTTAKSTMAHLEASAGMAGFAKCIMMVMSSATPPNAHLRLLNPHLTVDGYPVLFGTELTPWRQNSGYCGVSSFGIGGTNARGEVLGRCQQGAEAISAGLSRAMIDKAEFLCLPCPRCLGPMNWLDSAAIPKPAVLEGKYRAALIRDELADYTVCSQCYEGNFRLGDELREVSNPDYSIYIRGTWDAFRGMEEMEEVSTGVYVFHVALGETRCERFQLNVEKNPELAIYPARGDAGQHVRAQGPDGDGVGKCWLLDGRDTEVPAGTVYKVIFEWSCCHKRVAWLQVEEAEAPTGTIGGRGFEHTYSIAASWTSWGLQDLRRSGTGMQTLFEGTFKIGNGGKEQFHFVRDRDAAQVIYPGSHGAASSGPTPRGSQAKGPDAHGKDKHWVVVGQENERVTVQLSVVDAHVTVTVRARSLARSWESVEGWGRRSYSLVGPFNGWAPETCMEPSGIAPGTFVRRVILEDWALEFQLVADFDPQQLMYPQARRASSGLGFLEHLSDAAGPESAEDRCWLIQGEPGSTFDVVLDLAELDRRRMVTWAQVDFHSLHEDTWVADDWRPVKG